MNILPHPSQRAGKRAEQQFSQSGKSRGIFRRGLTGALAAAAALSLSFVPQGSPEAQAQSSMGSLSSSAGDLEDLAGIINGIVGGLQNGGGGGAGTAPSTDTHLSERSFTVNGKTRKALVKMPKSSLRKNLPVVFMFGGWQHDAKTARSYAGLENTAAGDSSIIVYPEPVRSTWKGQTYPAWGGAPYATNTTRSADVAFFRQIVSTLASEGKADRNRVYATGLSNGGGMALGLGCAAPDLVKGVVGVSGAYYTPTVSNCTAGVVPTMIIHGTNDTTVSYDGGTRHGASYLSVNEVHRQVADRNKCDVSRAPSAFTKGNITTYRYRGCAVPTVVKKVAGGGHTWYPSNPDAAQESWNFFR